MTVTVSGQDSNGINERVPSLGCGNAFAICMIMIVVPYINVDFLVVIFIEFLYLLCLFSNETVIVDSHGH